MSVFSTLRSMPHHHLHHQRRSPASVLAILILSILLIINTFTVADTVETDATPAHSSSSSSSSSPSSSSSSPPSLLSQLTSGSFHTLHILQSYPHPPQHFTQGLTIDNSIGKESSTQGNEQDGYTMQLYEGTGVWGSTYLHRFQLTTAGKKSKKAQRQPSLELKASVKLPPTVFGEGICLFEDKILQLTYHDQCFFQFPKSILNSNGPTTAAAATGTTPSMKISTPQDFIKIAYPPPGGLTSLLETDTSISSSQTTDTSSWNEGWGLTFNTHTNRFIVSDGSSTLYILQSHDLGSIENHLHVHYFDTHGHRVSVDNLNELEYIPSENSTPQSDRGEIFANYYESYCILRIHPETGLILGVLHADPSTFYHSTSKEKHASVEAMNGIAFHRESQKLFITGKMWKEIFEVETKIHPAGKKSSSSTTTSASASSSPGFHLDLQQHCPRLGMTSSDMNYSQQILTKLAEEGQEVEKKFSGGGNASVQAEKKKPVVATTPESSLANAAAVINAAVKTSLDRWAPVPPQSSAGRALITAQQTIKNQAQKAAAQSVEPTYHAPVRIERIIIEEDANGPNSRSVNAIDKEAEDSANMELSSSTLELLKEDSTTEIPHHLSSVPSDSDSSFFDSVSYIESETTLMEEERVEEYNKDPLVQIQQLLNLEQDVRTQKSFMSGDI